MAGDAAAPVDGMGVANGSHFVRRRAARRRSASSRADHEFLEDPKQSSSPTLQRCYGSRLAETHGAADSAGLSRLGEGAWSCICRASRSSISAEGTDLPKDAFVCVAGYGDYGPIYIPTNKAYGGRLEPTQAHAGPSEPLLYRKLGVLLRANANP